MGNVLSGTVLVDGSPPGGSPVRGLATRFVIADAVFRAFVASTQDRGRTGDGRYSPPPVRWCFGRFHSCDAPAIPRRRWKAKGEVETLNVKECCFCKKKLYPEQQCK